MRLLYERIEVAAARGTILVVGKSGTGKELVARAFMNPRSRRPRSSRSTAPPSRGAD